MKTYIVKVFCYTLRDDVITTIQTVDPNCKIDFFSCNRYEFAVVGSKFPTEYDLEQVDDGISKVREHIEITESDDCDNDYGCDYECL